MGAAAMGADMTEGWKDWEGRTVDGKFRLESYLGGSDASGVFRTEVEGAPAAIRLVAADAAEGEKQLQRWKEASEIHSHLIWILQWGRARVAGREVVYVVEEFAEENLGQVVPERALTADETRGMLKPILAGLEYLHGKGFVHGGVRPSHIFAVGDQVKISSDALLRPGEIPRNDGLLDAPELASSGGSAATDVWSLGMTLVEVMTQLVPMWDAARMTPPLVSEDVPEPFRTIAQRCLEIDPAKRWGIREIRERLEPMAVRQMTTAREIMARSEIAPPQRSSRRPLWAGIAAVVAIVAFLLLRPHSTEQNRQQAPAATPTATQSAPVETAPEQQSSRPSPLGAKAPESEDEVRSQVPAPSGDIVERATPDVSSSARRTIQGHIKVRVKVNVDPDGNVTGASLKEAGPSKYFARVAEEAAKRWKFVPLQDKGQDEARSWTLLFVFSRGGTEMSAARAK
jgi:TonB family protein